jgi:hypothetical protein
VEYPRFRGHVHRTGGGPLRAIEEAAADLIRSTAAVESGERILALLRDADADVRLDGRDVDELVALVNDRLAHLD